MFNKLIILLPFFSVLLANAQEKALELNDNRPNILVIITDQQRNDDMSCAGNKFVSTPNIDYIASHGVRFTKSYCASPLCVPSRASLATSRMPYEVMNDVERFKHIPADITSTGTLFRNAGYRTAWSGKWHVRASYPKKEENGGDLPGFEVLENKLLPEIALGTPEPQLPKNDSIEYNFDFGIADAAIEFLNQKQIKPFLLTVSILNPHGVCGNNEFKLAKFAKLIKGDLPPLPNNLNVPNQMITPEEGPHPSKGRKDNWKDISFQRYMYEYYRFTEETDRLIGKVLDVLRKNGLEKNTIIIFTSDHGEMLGAHHIVMKTVPYEEALSVPFILAGPGIPSNIVDDKHIISGLDMLPTLCGLAGIKGPSVVRGENINTIFKVNNGSWHDAVFATVDGNNGRIARTEHFKYIRLNRPVENEFLFDMDVDYIESKNLANDATYSKILAHHRTLLSDWMKKTNDPFMKIINK